MRKLFISEMMCLKELINLDILMIYYFLMRIYYFILVNCYLH